MSYPEFCTICNGTVESAQSCSNIQWSWRIEIVFCILDTKPGPCYSSNELPQRNYAPVGSMKGSNHFQLYCSTYRKIWLAGAPLIIKLHNPDCLTALAPKSCLPDLLGGATEILLGGKCNLTMQKAVCYETVETEMDFNCRGIWGVSKWKTLQWLMASMAEE